MSVIQHNVPVKLNPHSSGAALTYLSEVLEELRWRIRGSIKAREESRAAIIGERPDCPSSFPPPYPSYSLLPASLEQGAENLSPRA